MNSRNKGHRFERKIAQDLRELGFTECKTSRAVSKLLDDCGIDLAITGLLVESVPFLIQCKAGYEKKRPKPDVLFKYIEDKLNEFFPKDHIIHTRPKVLLHKLDNGKGTYMTLEYESNKHLLKYINDVPKDKITNKEGGNTEEQITSISGTAT